LNDFAARGEHIWPLPLGKGSDDVFRQAVEESHLDLGALRGVVHGWQLLPEVAKNSILYSLSVHKRGTYALLVALQAPPKLRRDPVNRHEQSTARLGIVLDQSAISEPLEDMFYEHRRQF
jgi:hypothetical protein